MFFRNRLLWNLAIILSGLLVGGCSLSTDNQQDDDKESHFVLGKSRVNALDFTGAVEAFKEALEVNPRSAAAHYQLAWIYENKLTNPAAAIYHYQEYLDLDPKAPNRDVVIQRIYSCKLQLLPDVAQQPMAPSAQHQIDKLIAENQGLQTELNGWRAWYQAQTNGHPVLPPQQYVPPAARPATTPGVKNAAGQFVTSASSAGHPRTHVVASGETLAAIARRAGVSLTALEAANPGLTPRHLHTGQTINLP